MSHIEIEVAYALPERQTLLSFEVDSALTIRQAIEASGILSTYPEVDLDTHKVGIFSRVIKDIDEAQVLKDRDRIEIYRPLICDPKEVRKRKAAEAAAKAKAAENA